VGCRGQRFRGPSRRGGDSRLRPPNLRGPPQGKKRSRAADGVSKFPRKAVSSPPTPFLQAETGSKFSGEAVGPLAACRLGMRRASIRRLFCSIGEKQSGRHCRISPSTKTPAPWCGERVLHFRAHEVRRVFDEKKKQSPAGFAAAPQAPTTKKADPQNLPLLVDHGHHQPTELK